MDIEAIVKKYSGSLWLHEGPLRAALTELAAGYEAVAQVTKMNSDRLLRKANERIRQLEAERGLDRETLVNMISDGLRGTYHCTRVWEAWYVGTMSDSDFEPVEESDTPSELADAVLSLLAAAPQQQQKEGE